jgi:hypothetical protein
MGWGFTSVMPCIAPASQDSDDEPLRIHDLVRHTTFFDCSVDDTE